MTNELVDLAIFSGRTYPAFAEAICAHLGMKQGEADIFEFANENIFVRYQENIRSRDVFLVQPFFPPVSTSILELLIMIDAARRASAGRITAVIPYYAYGRSDKKDQPRVPISARLLANLIETAGADRVLTMNLHAGQIQGFFNIPLDELHAQPHLAEYFRSLNLPRPVIVAPDVGGAKNARDVAERLGAELAIVDKRRTSNDEQAEAMTIIGDVEDRDAIIVDDEILTGGTVASALELLRLNRARSVYVGTIHPLFAGAAFDRLDTTDISALVFPDTVPVADDAFRNVQTHVLSVAPYYGDAMHRIHTGGSVGELFR